MGKILTMRYTFHQMAYWASAAGVVSFATAFLLAKGFAASQVGILLACGNLLSCALQPLLADRADRASGNILKRMMVGLTALSMLCFGTLQVLAVPQWRYGLLYLLGVFTFDAMMPLMNAISVSYSEQGRYINYGLGRGPRSCFSLWTGERHAAAEPSIETKKCLRRCCRGHFLLWMVLLQQT